MPYSKSSAPARFNRFLHLIEMVRTEPSADAFRARDSSRMHTNETPRLVEHRAADRSIAEAFIADRHRMSFGASIVAFMPRLFTMRNACGQVSGAFGLRSTSCRLFVEQYLLSPIEVALATTSGQCVERRSIVEVGHFSGAYPGAMRAMILLLTDYLDRERFEWLVFGGTASLRNAFARVGPTPLSLGATAGDGLCREADESWGHTHGHAPQVLAGRIRDRSEASVRHGAHA